MGQVELRVKAFAMERFIERKVKCWIYHIKRRRWMLQLPEDGLTVDVVQRRIVLIRLVGEPSVINKNIPQLVAALILKCPRC
jgi:hypothetical protein